MKTLRINNFGYIQASGSSATSNLTNCRNQIISDITGIYIGGVPDNFITRDESRFAATDFKLIQRNRFTGCLKNVTTILEINDINLTNSTVSKTKTLDFDFDKAQVANGEPENSNTIYGCPLDLESNGALNLLGFGYLYADLKQTMPRQFQTQNYLIIDFELRTEWNQGVIFFNFDYDNNQYVLVQLKEPNLIQIYFKSRVSYDENTSTNKLFLNYFFLSYNRTFQVDNLANGYWSFMNLQFDFVNQSLLLIVNGTRVGFEKLANKDSVPEIFFSQISRYTLLFNFYLDIRFYFGGYDQTAIDENIRFFLRQKPSESKDLFLRIFNMLKDSGDNLSFDGCMKNIKINSFQIDFGDLKNIVSYKNVRFDGCPRLSILLTKNSAKSDNIVDKRVKKINLISEGNQKFAFDTSFNPFTEYFYRVIASNSQGEARSDWVLLRTAESIPTDFVDIKYLRANSLTGFKLKVENLAAYCLYCDTRNRMEKIFIGIIRSFVMNVYEFNQTTQSFAIMTNFTFYCESVCLDNYNDISDMYKNLFNENANKETSLENILIDTLPVTKYSLTISICTSTGCVESDDSLIVMTQNEAPEGVFAPQVGKRSAYYLFLVWNEPKFPSGKSVY